MPNTPFIASLSCPVSLPHSPLLLLALLLCCLCSQAFVFFAHLFLQTLRLSKSENSYCHLIMYFISMNVCAFNWMHLLCVTICALVHVWECEGQRLVAGVFLCLSPPYGFVVCLYVETGFLTECGNH